MRRVAANIIIKDITTRLVNHVIELENGVIVNDYPLQVEREAVEWIGGMIVCSSSNKIDDLTNLRISEFIDKNVNRIYSGNSYAWHIYGLDITSDSIITERNITLLK